MKVNFFKQNEYLVSILTKFFIVSIELTYAILLARYLGKELKGQLSYIQSITAISSIVCSFGLHHAYSYYRRVASNKKVFLFSYMNIIVTLFVIYLAVSIALIFCLHMALEYKLCIILTPLMGYTRISGYVFLVENPNKRNFSLLFLSSFELIYVIVVSVFFNASLYIAVSVLLFIELIKIITFTSLLHFGYSFRLFNPKILVNIFLFGFFPMISLILTTLNYRVDIIMLKNASQITLGMVGIYSVGVAMAEKSLLIPDACKEILLSHLSKKSDAKETAFICRICIVLTILFLLFIIICGHFIFDYIFGDEYSSSYGISIVCSLGSVFMCVFKFITQYNIVNKMQKLNTVLLATSVAINIVLNYGLIPLYGIYGAAISTVFSHFICASLYLFFFIRYSKIPLSDILLIKSSDFKLFFQTEYK